MISFFNKLSVKKLSFLLVFITFLTYVSSFTNQFVWDDDHFFLQNTQTQAITWHNIQTIFTSNTTAGAGVSSNYYRPLATISFALDHAFWGWNPLGLHITNTLFHACNSILLLLWLIRLGLKKPFAFLLSMIFVVHPIQTEAVTYLSSRGDIFYTFFLLISLYCYTIALYQKTNFIPLIRKKIYISNTILLLMSVCLFPLSILSKEGALTTIPLYGGVLVLFAVQKKLSFKNLHEKYRQHFVTLGAIIWVALAYFFLRLTVLNFANSLNYGGDQTIYGKDLMVRMYTFLTTIPQYVQLLIIPYPLYLERSTPIIIHPLNGMVLLAIILIFQTLGLGIFEFKKKHTVWIFFGLLIIFSNLAAVSGIIPQTGLTRENWLYMPMIGFFLIAGETVVLFFDTYKQTAIGIFVFLCIIYAFVTVQHNKDWKNNITYFLYNLQFTNTARLHLNVGNAYIGQKQYDKAFFHLQQAIHVDDSYPQIHYNLAVIYIKENDFAHAEKELLETLAFDKNYLFSYPFLIQIYEKTGNTEKALPYLERLTRIYPTDLKMLIWYGHDLLQANHTDEAHIIFTKAITLSHNDPKLIQAINADMKR